MRQIILASESQGKIELLRSLIGDNFLTKTSDYEEDNNLDLEPLDLVLYHSLHKVRDVAKKFDSGIVIGADLLIVCDGKVLGKPKDKEDAIKALRKISNKKVQAISGLSIIDIDNNKEISINEVTDVFIKELDDEEIRDYVESGEPLGKAGSFAIQGKGSFLVKKIEGCYFNVIGLPLFRLSNILKELGINIFDLSR